MKESNIQKLIQLALSEAGYSFWRNEVAGVWVGQVVYKDRDTVTLKNARMITAGLAVGSSDLIGIGPDGRFAAVEVKTKTGKTTKDQENFIRAVIHSGGIAGVARSPEDALEILKNGK